ncbi:MAG: GNAT family N-acetyltransferase [Anaerolineales bacterium]|jgi:RimJ/RimL family protein N-acetyltransferase
MRPPDRIKTERLVLRIPALTDANILYDTYTQDPEVTRYVMWRPHTSVDQTLEFIKSCLAAWEGERRFPYVFMLKGSDIPIGMIDFHINGPNVGIGYVVGRAYWGRGYVPEAVNVIVKWALNQPSIYRVCADCDVENTASVRVMEKVGMQQEGVLKRFALRPNISAEPRDSYLYAIVK